MAEPEDIAKSMLPFAKFKAIRESRGKLKAPHRLKAQRPVPDCDIGTGLCGYVN